MNILPPALEAYCTRYTSSEGELLQQVARFTNEQHPRAHMLSGHLQGKLLEMISFMIRPRRILEIGTFTGYSALCLAKGLAPEGVLHTIELREEDAATAEGFFRQSEFKDRILLHRGEALTILDGLDETWDLVFIDADKVNYTNYFTRVLPKVRPQGFILADNTLFHGQVLEEEVKGKSAKAIQAFNDFLQEQRDVENVLLPLRDGLTLIRKL